MPTQPAANIRLHRFALSGHSHRVELFLSLLGLPYEPVEVDLRKGEQKHPAFLAKNPLGQVPVIEDGNLTLADSNAILVYLASRYDESGRWLPRESEALSRVQQWLSIAAGPLVEGPGVARRIKVFAAPLDPGRAIAMANQLFGVIDSHLAAQTFLVGDKPTIADVAIYTYTAVAHEGDIDLSPFKHIQAWLKRIEALPGFVPMTPAKR